MSPPTTTEPKLDMDVKPNLTQDDTESKDMNEIKPIVGRKRKASASNVLASPSKKGSKSYSRTPQDPEVVMALVKRALDDCPASTRNEIAAEFVVESRLLHISWANVMKRKILKAVAAELKK